MHAKGFHFSIVAMAVAMAFSPSLPGTSGETISVQEVAQRCNGTLGQSRDDREALICGKNFSIKIARDTCSYSFNGVQIYGQGPTVKSSNGLRIPLNDWQMLLVPLISQPKQYPVRRICVDAGHGGNDSGAHNQGLGLVEKNLTLDVAMRLEKLLRAHGYEVILTRNHDCYVSLDRRAEISNSSGADLFVCIHFNAAEAAAARGIESYVLPPRGTTSTARLSQAMGKKDSTFFPNNRQDEYNLLLAYNIEKKLIQLSGVRDRGVKRGRFRVLEKSLCPAVLIECGFISSDSDGKAIGDPNYRQALARAICDGIVAFSNHN
ncbi:MAG: N-acetylmuramoyl-L-alanine amidase [Puniceicoccales bacterium]|jgi:N-acetylmuramoyl-L-alanine amidase|nr:N-acetylmuramoyl-L-alanine amidase [Puniceicoccales bacterium]